MVKRTVRRSKIADVLLAALVCVTIAALASTDLSARQGQGNGQGSGPPKEAGPPLKIVPEGARVLVGHTRQFRLPGPPEASGWALVDSSGEGVGEIDQDGLFTALEGGWVKVGAMAENGDTLAATDTLWVMGGPTRVDKRNGRVFAANDTFVVVHFPVQAAERATIVLIEKRGKNELPPQAQGKGTAVAVFVFTALDEATGEDVGKKGFGAKVGLTLHYGDEEVPEGVEEDDLVVASFDEDDEEWEPVPNGDVMDVDPDANTITVGTDHASFWGVLDRNSLPTTIRSEDWGRIKARFGR